MDEMDEKVWVYASKPEHIAERILPAIAQVSFNVCSGAGHCERRSGRLLTFISHRPSPQERAQHLVGVRLGGEDPHALQQQIIAAVEEEYANRTGGAVLHIWHPKYAPEGLDSPTP